MRVFLLPLLVCLFPTIALAACTSTHLTPANVNDQSAAFSIKVDRVRDKKKGEYLHFHVTVKAKADKTPLWPRRSTTLEVLDGAALLSSCPVQAAEQGGEVSYSLLVAAKYADKSRVGFYEDHSGPNGEPAGRYFWFYLKDFAEPPEAPGAQPVPAGRESKPRLVFAGSSEAGDKIKLENGIGFRTHRPGEAFPALWKSLDDEGKLKGKVADHLRPEQIESVVILEVNIAVPEGDYLRNELFAFMTDGSRFQTGPLDKRFDKAYLKDKGIVAMFRTKKGAYGLITRYAGLTIIELNRYVGVIPALVADRK